MRNTYVVWLEWPEKCFRVNAEALRHLKALVSRGACIRRARSEQEFLKLLPTATHAIVWHFKKEWFAKAPRLAMLATPGAGRELVTLEAPANVRLHFGHFHGEIMAESVAAFVLAWARGFFAIRSFVGYGGSIQPSLSGWPRVDLSDRCFMVAGTKAVIVGYGRVGSAIGRKLEALGIAVRGFGRSNRAQLPLALKTADWLILALPSDTGTDNFLSRSLLRKLPHRAVVINVGRGNALDEEALVEALKRKRISGAYLDVFKGEPGPLQKIVKRGKAAGILGTDPLKIPQNIIKMPHCSAFSSDYIIRCFEELKHDGCL